MEVGRRGFFGLLGASALPMEAEDEIVREEKKKDEGFFVLEHPGQLGDDVVNEIRAYWNNFHGSNAPKLLVLGEGMKLKHSSNL